MRTLLLCCLAAGAASCGYDAAPEESAAPRREGTPIAVIDTMLPAIFEAAGTAEPLRSATLSTRLMGTITDVAVLEGDRVARGQVLVRIDASELDARRSQARAAFAEAEAVRRDAEAHAARISGLYRDSAATRAQLDQAETGLARAVAAIGAARGALAEVDAMSGYAEVKAPFAGTVTRRNVDRGDFAAPGAPLVTVEDASRMRIRAVTSPGAVKGYGRGDTVQGSIEGTPITATIEGIVPDGGNLVMVNALVQNDGRFVSGSAARLALEQSARPALLVPAAAITEEGDLTGVRAVAGTGAELRWIRIGRAVGDRVEVLSGLQAGDSVLVANPGAR